MFLEKHIGNQFQSLEKILNHEVIFCLIVIFQGTFGSLGLVQTPKFLTDLLKSEYFFIFRFIFTMCIAYTASNGQLELAIYSTAIFFILMHILRTEEERKEVPYMI